MMSSIVFWFSHWVLAAEPGSGVGQSVGAGSPFTDYTAAVAIYVFVIGGLVTALLIGGFLVINLGLLSKRPEDRIGKRTPSDLGILKSGVWPEEPYEEAELPAQEGEEQLFDISKDQKEQIESKKSA